MIFVCGHRASGKSALGRYLESNGYYVFDVGPFLRSYYEINKIGDISFNDFLEKMKQETDDPNFVRHLLWYELKRRYDYEMIGKKDLIILGFRSYEDIKNFRKGIEGVIFKENEIKILYIQIELDIALKRFLERDEKNTEQEFWEQIDKEKNWGCREIVTFADFLIENNHSMRGFLDTARKIF